MKKFTSLLIGLSLTVVGAAFAQNPEESPAGGGKKQGKQKTEQTETKAPKTQGATGEQGAGAEKGHKGKGANATGATTTEQGATGTEQGTGKGHKGKAANATGNESNVSGQTTGGATTETGAGKGHKGRGAKAETSTTAGATGTNAEAGASATIAPLPKGAVRGERGMKGNRANANANAAPSASAAPSVAATGATGATATTGQTNTTTNVGANGAATAHVEKEKVQQVKQQVSQIKQQHASFRAQARPDRVPAVTFNQNFRIEGSDRWSGPQYEVFRSYHPERHDRGWYHQRYQRVELIGGGYYYWHNNYWYPAWGYDPGNEYYAYDAPIYVGHRAEPPDRVIADVQAELQQMGYYQGDVDGLLGPMTREALTAYQADQGLEVTAVIDEPTLDSLNMG